jgi:hypothetical protein
MQTIEVKNQQSLLDIAIEHIGDVAAMLPIAEANNLALSQIIPPGTRLTIDATKTTKTVTNIFRQNNFSPASQIPQPPIYGIEEFVIGIDAQILE